MEELPEAGVSIIPNNNESVKQPAKVVQPAAVAENEEDELE